MVGDRGGRGLIGRGSDPTAVLLEGRGLMREDTLGYSHTVQVASVRDGARRSEEEEELLHHALFVTGLSADAVTVK